MKLALAIMVSSLAAVPLAFAQTPPDAGSLLWQQEQLEHKLPQQFPEAETPEVVKPTLNIVPGLKVQVKVIRFSGATDLVSEAELRALVADAIGKTLDFAGLQAFADKVTEYLRSKGWLTVVTCRARTSHKALSRSPSSGERLDGSATDGGGWQVSLSDDPRIDVGTLSAIAETAAASDSVVRREGLERALLLINDLPGISARSRLEPGSETVTTCITVDAAEGPLLTGYLWADNYSNSSTGEKQLNAALNLNDPIGLGDQTILSASVTDGIRVGRLGYSIPVGTNGLHASAGYSAMHYNVGPGKTVTVSGLSIASLANCSATAYGYQLASARGPVGGIMSKVLSIRGSSAADKVDDGTTDATVSGDIVTVSGTGVFDDKNVSTVKVVSASHNLGGTNGGNYTLAGETLSADITVSPLTLSDAGIDWIYDGTTDATMTTSDDCVASDELTISETANFADKNVGTGKAVSVSRITAANKTSDGITKDGVLLIQAAEDVNAAYDERHILPLAIVVRETPPQDGPGNHRGRGVAVSVPGRGGQNGIQRLPTAVRP